MDRNTLILLLIAALVLLAVFGEAMKAFERAERQLEDESKEEKAPEGGDEKDE